MSILFTSGLNVKIMHKWLTISILCTSG